MSEFVGGEEKIINVNDKIVFENKTDSIFEVGVGIIFHKSGLYDISILGNRVIVTKVANRIEASVQPEPDGLDAIRHAREILWDKCKRYLADHTDEICPILHGKYEEEYTGMINEMQSISRVIYIMEGMKNRGEI